MKVSVVIPTFNRARVLARCLPAVLTQDWTDYEVLVVDDGSTDGTRELVQREFPQVRYLRLNPHGGEAAARNLGVAESSGAIVAFTDDDCIVPPDWLTRHLRYYEDPSIGAVGGPQAPRAPSFCDRYLMAHYAEQFFQRVRRIEHISGFDALWTNNLTVRREVFETVGVFDEDYQTGCDSDFTRRVNRVGGYVLISDPSLRVEHLKVLSLALHLRIRFHRGCGVILDLLDSGGLSVRQFLPLPNPLRAYKDWRHYRGMFGGNGLTLVRFCAVVILTRAAEVSGRVYYYWKVGRRSGAASRRSR